MRLKAGYRTEKEKVAAYFCEVRGSNLKNVSQTVFKMWRSLVLQPIFNIFNEIVTAATFAIRRSMAKNEIKMKWDKTY